MPDTSFYAHHVIGLDGRDDGGHRIRIGPSGIIEAVRPDGAERSAVEVSVLPLLADAHAHLGLSDGMEESPDFHTLDHVDAQLEHLARWGIGHIVSLGTDQPWLQDLLRRRVASCDPSGRAFGYSAGIGFGAVGGWPPELTGPDTRFRPTDVGEARAEVRRLGDLGCRILKIWVDDFGGKVPKIPVPIVRAIINEARKQGVTTFAHVHFHADAVALVELGIDVLAHSIRDQLMEDHLLDLMVRKGTTLIPTLAREEAEINFSLADNPYLADPFFGAVEAPWLARLRTVRFSDDPETPRGRLAIAMRNVERAAQAGVPISLGTDSGFRTKLLGFAQHRELQLLHQAGLGIRQCLHAALGVNHSLFASGMNAIVPGVPASFLVVEGDVTRDIAATTAIRQVWCGGKRIV